jgi:hypothetical protein
MKKLQQILSAGIIALVGLNNPSAYANSTKAVTQEQNGSTSMSNLPLDDLDSPSDSAPAPDRVDLDKLLQIDSHTTLESIHESIQIIDRYDLWIAHNREQCIENIILIENQIQTLDYVSADKKKKISDLLHKIKPEQESILQEQYEIGKQMGEEARLILQLLVQGWEKFTIQNNVIQFENQKDQLAYQDHIRKIEELKKKSNQIEQRSLFVLMKLTSSVEAIMSR